MDMYQKILAIILFFSCSIVAYPMVRYVFPKKCMLAGIVSKGYPFLLSQKQEQPLIEINQKIYDFIKKYGIVELSEENKQLLQRESERELQKALLIPSGQEKPDLVILQNEKIKNLIKAAFQKHGLDFTAITFYETRKEFFWMRVDCSNNFIVNLDQTEHLCDEDIFAMIEHEISHIIHEDVFLINSVANAIKNSDLVGEFRLLVEQRADTYSALQSLHNAEFLNREFEGSRYPFDLKKLMLKKWLQEKQEEKLCKKLYPYLNYNHPDQWASLLYRDGYISFEEYQEFQKLFNVNKYSQDLVMYMQKRQDYKNTYKNGCIAGVGAGICYVYAKCYGQKLESSKAK